MVTSAPASTPVSTSAGRAPGVGRLLVPLGAMFLFVGLSTAVVGPFVSLFLSTTVKADPLHVAAFLVAGPVSMVVSSTLIGRLSDRRPVRRQILAAAAAAGGISATATAFVRDYWVLLALTVTVTAISGSLFPQAFAYAREILERRGSTRAAMTISTLRMLFSIAWVAGPPIAAVLLDAGGFRVLYLTAAVMYGAAVLVAVFVLDDVAPAPKPPRAEAGHAPARVLQVVAALTLLQAAGTLGVQAMSLYLSHDLRGSVRDAGLVLGLCAALEIPLMLGFGALSTRWPLHRLIVIGAGLGVLYYVLVAASTHTWQVGAAQLVNASFIAAVQGLGISYVQEMLPGEPGRAATLAGNAYPVAAILAGPLFGLAQHFGYRYAYAAGATLCAAGVVLLLTSRRPRRS
ncbi:sugar efflux transporter [Dactylosporangium sp. NBC_01737]|uniref:sugar efflux transporter n=1 Tax=Dactylosporangium sp. NBC_01737 TaxID=2975959 RepID=UPI002E147B83|nr:sugar efflux transporter [Dactylosporangium sp. NBC_01737]